MALHPCQHLVDLAHLPGPVGKLPIGEQRVGLVEDEERVPVARLGEGIRDLLLRSADPHRQQVGGPLLQHFQPEPLGEVADPRTLARPRRPLKAEGEAPRAGAGDAPGQRGGIGIGPDQRGVEALGRSPGRLTATQQPRKAAHAAPHGLDVAAGKPGRGRGPRGDAGCGLEFCGQRARLLRPRLDTVAFELPRPDPRPDRAGRRAQLEGEHHAPENGRVHLPGVVHRPQRRRRRPFKQPVHEDPRVAAPGP